MTLPIYRKIEEDPEIDKIYREAEKQVNKIKTEIPQTGTGLERFCARGTYCERCRLDNCLMDHGD